MVSYELVVQRFENGDAAPMALATFRSVGQPHTDRHEPQHHCWPVTADDGGEADLYAELARRPWTGLDVHRTLQGR